MGPKNRFEFVSTCHGFVLWALLSVSVGGGGGGGNRKSSLYTQNYVHICICPVNALKSDLLLLLLSSPPLTLPLLLLSPSYPSSFLLLLLSPLSHF
jgi:hypothetical protein